ncbi:MAG: hypothetical protein KA501_12240 [Bacteroidia bacterium]|jgi:hypothetical protein|nr:hypothetical protein [Bacteroidia bacterium]
MKKFLLITSSFFLVINIFSQTVFDIGIQFSPRFEQRRGYQTLPPVKSKSAFFISERARLNVGFRAKFVKLYVSLQDVRVWGDEGQALDVAGFGLHEGWAELFINDSISFKLGRQELVYDDHRLLGNLDWVQQARSHDAAVFKFRHKGISLHVGGAFNQASEGFFGTYYTINNYKALAFLWYNHKFLDEKLKLSFYAVTDGFNADTSLHSKEKVLFRGTVGPLLNAKAKNFSANAALYVQFGKNTFNTDVLSYFAYVYADYTFAKKFTIGLGCDYLSGNDFSNASNTRDNRFNTLYPTNHKFYGHMDYFLNIPKDTKGTGLINPYLRLSYMPCQTGKLTLDAHYFFTANKLKNPEISGAYLNRELGLELDLYGSYKPISYIEIKGGYSTMLASTTSLEALSKVAGGSRKSFAGWGWLQVNVNPTVFKWEKN